jgi:hypothetical protein
MSNGGRNDNVAFLAINHEVVIGVYSCDANGNKSTFSPDPLKNSDNFCVLGEVIESSWPSYLEVGKT